MTASRSEHPYRQLTTVKTLLVSSVLFLLGVVLLFLAEAKSDFWNQHKAFQAVTKDTGSLLMVSFALGVVWELVGKRSFAREVLEVSGTSADITAAGLRNIGTSWLEDADWAELFDGVKELDIFVAYGQTWRAFNLGRLEYLAKRRGARIGVFLPDPDDLPTMEVLSARFSMTIDQLKGKIAETRSGYEGMRVRGGATISVSYFAGDRLFSIYRFGGTAVITLYRHKRDRSASIPTIVCKSPGSLFEFARSEIASIQENSRPAT